MDSLVVDGVIIKTSVTGEADKILWILTSDRGIIRAFAKGARSLKSKLHGCSSLFCYGSFSFYEKHGVYTVKEAKIKEMFFSLRDDLYKMTLAEYFCEVMLKTVPDNVNENEYLRLFLNSLHYLTTNEKPALMIKAVFELRLTGIEGYMPSLVACEACGEFKSETMFFDHGKGCIYCEECGKGRALPPIPFSIICAMRHIFYSPFEKIFSFLIPDEQLKQLSDITEKYLSFSLQQKFQLLDYLDIIK